jgi:LDH2 family malate/lactate/ureidoglycolate dehydrogenase
MARFSSEQLKALTSALAEAAGAPREDAAILADSLVSADLSGTATHGVSRLAIYLKRIKLGLIDPRAKLRIARERPGTIAVDAGNGLGQIAGVRTLELLFPRAKQNGVACATIRNSQHFGALSYYCNVAADRNMILIATTNCEPAMSPQGGRDPFFGTNPIACSFPTGKGFHVKIDLATSVIARGKIIAAQKKGETIPDGWALGPDGNPTTDPSQALLGTVLTMAGHRGYALALMVEGLSGALSGAAIGTDVGSMYKHLDRKQDVGHFFCLLDVDAFMDVMEFKRRMDETIERIKQSRKRPGIGEILVPGERSHRTMRENLAQGVPVDPATFAELQKLCNEMNVPFTLAREPAA